MTFYQATQNSPEEMKTIMKTRNPHPRLFNEVLDAIAHLREKKGSSTKTIMSQVDSILSMKRKQLRSDANQFYKALKHGLATGLITEKSGRYRLGLQPREYKVFRDFQRMMVCDDYSRQHRRGRKGGRRKGRKRRGRKRKHESSVPSGTDEYVSDYSSYTTSPRVTPSTPEDKGRKRGRKRKVKRKRRGSKRNTRGRKLTGIKGETQYSPETINSEENQITSYGFTKSTESRKSIVDKNKEGEGRDKKDRKDEDRSREYESRRDNTDETLKLSNHQHCENPNCLCNMDKTQEGNHSHQ
ncbi:uncharacterized protein isoform X1 [Leptinotarsa decemlineata]|uniref:uncharacterized protein isoform X1 n=2 Tax=Leptinotarsa decemlineata TaxID=7539 RepID=UPI003D304DB5